MRIADGVGVGAPPPAPEPDLSALPVVVRILVQKMVDDPSARAGIRDRLAEYVQKESQGVMPVGTARTLNRILLELGVAPVRVPEAAEVGSLEEMVRQHRSVDRVWDGARYVPISEADRAAREWAIDQVIARVKSLTVPAPSLSRQEQLDAREILTRSLRALGPSPTV